MRYLNTGGYNEHRYEFHRKTIFCITRTKLERKKLRILQGLGRSRIKLERSNSLRSGYRLE